MKPGPLEDISAPNKWKLVTLTGASVVLLLLSVAPAFVDPVLAYAIYAIRISTGTLLYNILSNEMAGALVEAYIFNITNLDKFLSGEDYKMKVEEIGPFTYQEFREHENFFLNEENNTLHYTPHISTRFHRNLSVADPRDLNVTVPNVPMLTMISTLGTYPYWTQLSFNMLVNRLNAEPVINLPAHDFMWGYKEPFIALGNTLMPGWINFEKLGVLDRLYDQTVKDNLVVGATNADKFRIKTVNGEGGITNRGYDPNIRDRCNTFVNTYEGVAYPPRLTPETELRIYRNVFCRILDLQYAGTKDMEYGSEAFVYRLRNTTFKKSPENECLCGKVCIDGMTDLSTCFYGFGVAFSQAHFFDVDPVHYERIDGMKPDFEKHGSEFLVDPNLGTVMNTRITFQLNVVVENADYNAKTKPFSNIIIPVLYFRILQPELPDETKTAFKQMYLVLPYIVLAIQVVLFLAAIGIQAYAMRFIGFEWLCKKAIGFQVNKGTSRHVNEEALVEENVKFVVESIAIKQFVDTNDFQHGEAGTGLVHKHHTK